MSAHAIVIGNVALVPLEHPEYAIAHPGDRWRPADELEPCEQCLLAIRPDTGELVLLWGVGCDRTRDWGISREDPNYKRHRAELVQ